MTLVRGLGATSRIHLAATAPWCTFTSTPTKSDDAAPKMPSPAPGQNASTSTAGSGAPASGSPASGSPSPAEGVLAAGVLAKGSPPSGAVTKLVPAEGVAHVRGRGDWRLWAR